MATIICPKCKENTDRLHRYNSGDSWMCPTCYVGMYCSPTPQTQWPEPSTDNVQQTVTPAQVKQVYSFPHVILAKVINGQAQPDEIKSFILKELKS